jgi:hypothetical protein
VICVEISVPPPEFYSSDSMGENFGSGILNGASMTWYKGSVKWSTKDFVALVFASRQFFHV